MSFDGFLIAGDGTMVQTRLRNVDEYLALRRSKPHPGRLPTMVAGSTRGRLLAFWFTALLVVSILPGMAPTAGAVSNDMTQTTVRFFKSPTAEATTANPLPLKINDL